MPRPRHRLVLFSVLALVPGCAGGGLDVSPDLGGVPPLVVEGRGGWRVPDRIGVGEWEAVSIDRSWARGSGWRFGGTPGAGSSSATQDFRFTFTGAGAEPRAVECTARSGRRTVTAVLDVDVDINAGLECGVRTEDDAPEWALVLGARRDRHLEGHLQTGEVRYAVVSRGTGGGLAPARSRGFEILSGERVLAAVETVGRGAVWLSPELPAEDRAAVAQAAAALLLYEPVSAD